MELNFDIKRLPPAQERPREQEKWSQNTGMLPMLISGPNRGIL